MNARTAKAYRKFLRDHAPATTQDGYVTGPARYLLAPNLSAPLNLDGTPKMRPVAVTGTIRLAAGSPRSALKRLKAMGGRALIRSLVGV